MIFSYLLIAGVAAGWLNYAQYWTYGIFVICHLVFLKQYDVGDKILLALVNLTARNQTHANDHMDDQHHDR